MNPVNYDTHILMIPSLVCTFDCVYCRQHNNCMESLKKIETRKFVDRLDKLNRICLVGISGGEPFLIPNFREFAAEVTKKHYIRIDTNLSLVEECRKFIEVIDPERVVEIVFSVHILEREKRNRDLMELVSLVNEFQAKGFKMVGNYVSYPPLLGRLEKDIDFFKSYGIKVLPTLFGGKFNGKNYPLDNGKCSYSREELELIVRLNPYANLPLHNPLNEFCQAGCTAFWVTDKYEVFPCLTMQTMRDRKLGDFFGKWTIFPKVIRCPQNYCTDQYNKILCCSLSGFHLGLGYTQLKAMSERGACSLWESRLFFGLIFGKAVLRKIRNIVRSFFAR